MYTHTHTHVCVCVCVCVHKREEKLAEEREAKRLILAAKRVQRGLKFSKVLYTLSKVLYIAALYSRCTLGTDF